MVFSDKLQMLLGIIVVLLLVIGDTKSILSVCLEPEFDKTNVFFVVIGTYNPYFLPKILSIISKPIISISSMTPNRMF